MRHSGEPRPGPAHGPWGRSYNSPLVTDPGDATGETSGGSGGGVTDLESTTRAVDDLLDRCRVPMNLPGIALAITNREELLHTVNAGVRDVASGSPVEPETLFEIGSISKSFTALLVLQLREEGLLDLHAPVTDVLPWFTVKPKHAPITAHHLLTHTAGLVQGSEMTPAAVSEVWRLRKVEVGGPPGWGFHYSNHGYKTLGLMVQRLTGRPFGDVLRERILEPLGMNHTEPVIARRLAPRMATGYEALLDDRPLGPGGRLAAAGLFETDTADGSIASTAEDMAVYLRMLLNGGAGPDGPIVSPEAFEQMITPLVPSSDPPYHEAAYGYGLNVQETDGRRRVGHGGGMVGYSAHIDLDLDAGIGVVVLTNGPWSPWPLADFTLRAACAAVTGGAAPDPPELDYAKVPDAERYAGTYVATDGSGSSLTIRVEGDSLVLSEGEHVVKLVHTDDPGAFVAAEGSIGVFALRFERRGDDVVGVVHGPGRFLREGFADTEHTEADDETEAGDSLPMYWRAFVGHYRAHNPWFTNFRVVARDGHMVLIAPQGVEAPEGEAVLLQRRDGAFQVGEAATPERIRFDTLVDGVAIRARLSGGDYYRTFTP